MISIFNWNVKTKKHSNNQMPNTLKTKFVNVIDAGSGLLVSIDRRQVEEDKSFLFLTNKGQRVIAEEETKIDHRQVFRFTKSHYQDMRNRIIKEDQIPGVIIDKREPVHVQNQNLASRVLHQFTLSQLQREPSPKTHSHGADGDGTYLDFVSHGSRNPVQMERSDRVKDVSDLEKEIGELRTMLSLKDATMENIKKQYANLAEQQCQILRTDHRREMETIKAEHALETQNLTKKMTEAATLSSSNEQWKSLLDEKESQIHDLRKKEKEYADLVRSMESTAKKNMDEQREMMMDLRKGQATKMIEMAKKCVTLSNELQTLKEQHERQCLEYSNVQSENEEQKVNLQRLTQALRERQTELDEARQNEAIIDSRYGTAKETILTAYSELQRQIQALPDRANRNLVASAVAVFQNAVSLLEWGEMVEVVEDMEEHGNGPAQAQPCVDRVAIDGKIEFGDRAVFVRSPNSKVWRAFTTDEVSQVYMHPLSLEVLRESLENYEEHIAISGRIVMVEDQVGNPLSLTLDTYQLAMVSFDDL